MKRSLAAALLAFLLSAACAHAATDCAKTSLAADESARDYLEEYAEACIGEQVEARRKKWALSAADFSAAVPAWRDVAAAFERLADAAPAGRMQDVHRQFAARAQAAAEHLKSGLEARKLDDVAVFRRDAWERVKMNLPEYRQAGFADIDVGRAMDEDCKAPASTLCAATLRQGKEFMLRWKLADALAYAKAEGDIGAIAKQVAAKDALWNRFLYDSKPMLPFDFILTDLLERQWSKSDQYPQGFREPPRRQWFLLHPSVAVEYASAAADGEQLKPVLYLELVGVNYWDEAKRPMDVPLLRYFSGASLIVSYADRAGIKDTGLGVLLTFDNVYSIGVSRYSGETGISLSLDLANLYRDKLKPKYELWKNQLSR